MKETPQGLSMSSTAVADSHAAMPSRGAADSPSTTGLMPTLMTHRRWIVPAIVLVGVLGFVFWDFLLRQFQWALREQADWGHTLVIPFIAGYLAYKSFLSSGLRSGWGDRTLFRTTWIGLAPVVVGVAAYFFASVGPQAVRHHNLQGAGFGLTLFGLVLLFGGPRAMRWLAFPLAYLVLFGQSISYQFMHLVTFKMQDIAAAGAHFMFVILGVDASRSGNILTVFHGGVEHPLNIAEACSGMRMLMAFLALGVAMGYLGLSRNWQRVLIVALAIPIAIFVNMLRVVTLGFLSIYDAEFAAGDFHSFIGLIWLLPAFLLFLAAMWAVKQIVLDGDGAPSAAAPRLAPGLLFDRRAKWAFFISCGALLFSGIAFHAAVMQLNIYLRKDRIDLREHFTTIPRTLDNWHAIDRDRMYDAAIIESLGTDEYLDRDYVRVTETGADGPRISLHIAYYTGMIDAVPHIPDRCMLSGGFVRAELPEVLPLTLDKSRWELDSDYVNRRSGEPYPVLHFNHRVTGRPTMVRLPIGNFRIRTTEFRHPTMGNTRIYAGFFFIANGHVTPYPLEVRRFAFDRTDKYAYYCKVQLMMLGPADSDFDISVFAETASDFMSEALPEIMRCLPDWAEVERKGDS